MTDRRPAHRCRLGRQCSPSDALRALDAISAGIAAGELTDGEAKTLTDLVGRFIEAFRIVELHDRLEAVEQRLKESQSAATLESR